MLTYIYLDRPTSSDYGRINLASRRSGQMLSQVLRGLRPLYCTVLYGYAGGMNLPILSQSNMKLYPFLYLQYV